MDGRHGQSYMTKANARLGCKQLCANLQARVRPQETHTHTHTHTHAVGCGNIQGAIDAGSQ